MMFQLCLCTIINISKIFALIIIIMKSSFDKVKAYFKNLRIEMKINKLIKLNDKNQYDKVAKLFKKAQDYHELKVDSFPFLYLLISQGKQQAAKIFLDKVTFKDQIMIDDNNPLKCNPLVFSVLQAKYQFIPIFQNYSGNIHVPNSQLQNLLHLAAIYRRNQAFQYGIRKGVDINLKDNYGNTPFHYACRTGIVEMITSMIVGKAKKVANNNFQYPIHMAIESGQYNAFLLLAGDLNQKYEQCHPIHSATRSQNIQIIRHIVNIRPTSINLKDHKGLTPLHIAVLSNEANIVKFLLFQKEILIDQIDAHGNTPLHLAFFKNNLQIIRLLVDKNANLDIVNEDYMTPAEYALSSSNPEVISYIQGLKDKSKKLTQWTSFKY